MGNSLFHGVTSEKVRVRSIKEHAATTAHKSSEGALQARADPQGGALVSAFDRMDAAIKEKMVKLFNIAYFIAKEEASFTMFPKLVALHQTNGLDLGSTYSNDQACRIFITAIGSCFFEELQQSLKSARFFSIMSDSSVDRSVKDQELIYCTYLQNGKPVNQLIQIVALDHANSQGILDAILSGLLKVVVAEGDLKKRLVGFGCDGASVMLGVNNGVTARHQRLCPSLVPIWRVAHCLELVALDSVKQVPQLQDIKQTLCAIHKHYTCSAKASRELEEISKAMEISIVRPGNTEGTRWLPHMSHALEALMRNYRPILIHFENHASDPNDKEASAAMKGRAKLVQQSLKQQKMLLFIHLMLDVLQELKQLSLLFQRDGLTLQIVTDGLQTTTLALVAMQFQHMQVIAEISLVLPMSSSCYERGFSSMKRIKSDWRSCLSNEMLNCLLQIWGLLFRGDSEDDEGDNNGNFLKAIDLLAAESGKEAVGALRQDRRYGQYSSPESQMR
ncbi:hypothetical protein AAFF_G00176860 [Aldrovandia affinis]|uniref:Uncharacterized protein n=1 Tax=Aldrovandia affinis TaxID=143900 RepID=A0AAD7RLE9_9TELE|nr:hypothetical protein AAFF_G00176860 [Aldrovandia affinis]